ncbi:hypothetical protein HPP92_025553 [Vanilla planifolia]|uniref:SAP domain-containing protein n=1 Tax=Vanilla planifolia TaxID=51239 RepID=A0A835U7V4_VANPL|nr:hypothetical protein HPP92_025553 [Vanilla planifolia]
MALSCSSSSQFRFLPPKFINGRRPTAVNSSAAVVGRKERRSARKTRDEDPSSTSKVEKALRFTFMEELMDRARCRDSHGVSQVISDMVSAGLNPGPRSFHGLVVSYALSGDVDGATQSLRRELSIGLCPLHETFVAMVRLFGSQGHPNRGLEVLAAMEKLNFDIRKAWLCLVEELVKNHHLDDANAVFLEGLKGGLRATDELYDRLIEEDCKAGDHSNALTIAYEMEAAGRMATTFHFNCLLSVQATCGIPEIAFATFENMEYGGEDYMKPDVESYNWVIQAYTRAESYDRLLVECFTKYCIVGEAIRHFRALKNFSGGTMVLYNDGNFGDPLSLYLRALCREGRAAELFEALEAMSKDNQPIAPRAMILNRKYRTLVSSWIEPLHEEADVGFEIDYVARYIAEGGLTGERKRWVPRSGKIPLDPDAQGFAYSNSIETSFKQRCLEESKIYHQKLLETLKNEGPKALGKASDADYLRVVERLRKIIKGPVKGILKPKAASKMIVSELKEELEGQGLPIDGTRPVLYQRVQKARRINLSRGRPLWVPPIEEEEEEVDEDLEELISRIKLEDGNTEFWKHRFLGEGFKDIDDKDDDVDEENKDDKADEEDDGDPIEDAMKESEDGEVDEEDDGVEQTENQADLAKPKKVERTKVPQMIGVQLLKDSEVTSTRAKKSRRKPAQVIKLGGKPTIGDCAMILRAAIRAPLPAAFLTILREAHKLGYIFGSPLYVEIISLSLDLGELDAAIAIVAEMENTGIKVPDETLDMVLSAKQNNNSSDNPREVQSTPGSIW